MEEETGVATRNPCRDRNETQNLMVQGINSIVQFVHLIVLSFIFMRVTGANPGNTKRNGGNTYRIGHWSIAGQNTWSQTHSHIGAIQSRQSIYQHFLWEMTRIENPEERNKGKTSIKQNSTLGQPWHPGTEVFWSVKWQCSCLVVTLIITYKQKLYITLLIKRVLPVCPTWHRKSKSSFITHTEGLIHILIASALSITLLTSRQTNEHVAKWPSLSHCRGPLQVLNKAHF